MVWGDIIVDGHNRYEICQKYNIPYEVKEVEFDSKDEAVRWMVRQQIGRRTLTPLQRIAIVEKYRPFYEKQAKENLKQASGGDRRSKDFKKKQGSQNSSKVENKIDVRAELSNDANVSTDTYSKGLKILKSGNEDLINQTLNGEKTINKSFKELRKSQEEKPATPNKEIESPDKSNELQDLKETKRKEVAQKLKEVRTEHGIESPEYEAAKEEQLNVEVRINELENAVSNPPIPNTDEITLSQIKKRYSEYFEVFQKDIDWLSAMDFYQNNEDVTGKAHSELKNCLEKFKGIHDMMQRMSIDEFGSISIDK